MSENLGRLEDLPADYVDGLVSQNTLPLWPSLRAMLSTRHPEPQDPAAPP
jgi:gentisate 1,2-dioxygenase